jgi:hypothetical protein
VRIRESQGRLIKEAARNAKEILKRMQLRPTRARVEKLIKHPKILAEAQRRLDFLETMRDKISIADLFPTG